MFEKSLSGRLDTIPDITTSEISAELRWAPHEQFFQNKVGRRNILNKYPIMTLQYAKGLSGLFSGQYNYDAFHLNIFKRFYVSPFGFSDVFVLGRGADLLL